MGCSYANKRREDEQGLEYRCAFCRELSPKSKEEGLKRIMKRAKKNDPVAMTQLGKMSRDEGDYRKALEYYTKAIELGHVAGHGCLGTMCYNGNCVDVDEKNAVYHLEQAAIGGHPDARRYLALHEMENGRFEEQ
jgi:TPR repeat protein